MHFKNVALLPARKDHNTQGIKTGTLNHNQNKNKTKRNKETHQSFQYNVMPVGSVNNVISCNQYVSVSSRLRMPAGMRVTTCTMMDCPKSYQFRHVRCHFICH